MLLGSNLANSSGVKVRTSGVGGSSDLDSTAANGDPQPNLKHKKGLNRIIMRINIDILKTNKATSVMVKFENFNHII